MTSPGTMALSGPAYGRVRWRRFAAIFAPAFLAIAALLILAAQGAIGVSFAVSGTPFHVTASEINGTGFEQWGSLDATLDNPAPHIPVFVSSFNSATLTNLCQAVHTGLPSPLPSFLVIKASPAKAQNLVVDAQSLNASSATFTNINIGQDPNSFTNPHPQGLPNGTFGQQADTAVISGADQQAIATTAGTFTLPGLSISFAGADPC